MKKLNYIDELRKLNTDYDFSLFVYENVNSKSIVVCRQHGEFETSLKRLKIGQRCPACFKKNRVYDTQSFVDKASKIHNYKYKYDDTIWIDSKSKVIIKCEIHGEFSQFASNHLKGYGCNLCKREESFVKFKEKATIIHGKAFDYSKSSYVNNKKHIEITCKKHGVFQQRPDNHLQGNGCPKCYKSLGEEKIISILEKLEIDWIPQKTFENCKNKYKLRFDFWLPRYNLCIEWDGPQHYQPIDFFGGQETLERNNKHDNIKNIFCINNNINLLRINYLQEDNIETLLLDSIKK